MAGKEEALVAATAGDKEEDAGEEMAAAMAAEMAAAKAAVAMEAVGRVGGRAVEKELAVAGTVGPAVVMAAAATAEKAPHIQSLGTATGPREAQWSCHCLRAPSR